MILRNIEGRSVWLSSEPEQGRALLLQPVADPGKEGLEEEAEQLLQEANARIERTIREIKEAQAEKEETRRVRQSLEDYRIREVENQENLGDEEIERKMEKIRRRQEKKKKSY